MKVYNIGYLLAGVCIRLINEKELYKKHMTDYDREVFEICADKITCMNIILEAKGFRRIAMVMNDITKLLRGTRDVTNPRLLEELLLKIEKALLDRGIYDDLTSAIIRDIKYGKVNENKIEYKYLWQVRDLFEIDFNNKEKRYRELENVIRDVHDVDTREYLSNDELSSLPADTVGAVLYSYNFIDEDVLIRLKNNLIEDMFPDIVLSE